MTSEMLQIIALLSYRYGLQFLQRIVTKNKNNKNEQMFKILVDFLHGYVV